MKETLEAWRFGDPADVVERAELQDRAAVRRVRVKAMDQTRQRERARADQQLILDRIFKKASRK